MMVSCVQTSLGFSQLRSVPKTAEWTLGLSYWLEVDDITGNEIREDNLLEDTIAADKSFERKGSL